MVNISVRIYFLVLIFFNLNFRQLFPIVHNLAQLSCTFNICGSLVVNYVDILLIIAHWYYRIIYLQLNKRDIQIMKLFKDFILKCQKKLIRKKTRKNSNPLDPCVNPLIRHRSSLHSTGVVVSLWQQLPYYCLSHLE